jgi:peptidoglycan/xylan/chitin deacetylase (PgdA/CDA1 family)
MKIRIVGLFLFYTFLSCSPKKELVGQTEITKWQDGKRGAVSITLDDASINQFRQALPIMDSLILKATFFIIISQIQNSVIQPQFLGRAIEDIVKETATIPTNQENFFERASAIRFTGLKGAVEFHNNAGSLFESNKVPEAYHTIDTAFEKVRKEKAIRKVVKPSTSSMISWPELKAFAANGHEFGSHTLSHPRLSVLDEKNMLYELEKSKEEVHNQLGPDHTFSAECPFGTENERVMNYAYKIYPALRNRMPEPFLEELNRASKGIPGISKKEYVQWQRGPLQKTSMELMKSWVDTLLVHDNIWLCLTFHGVDGIGWEAKPHQEHAEYFGYIKAHKDSLWVATFGDVTKYMRERMSAKIDFRQTGETIVLSLRHSLDGKLYALPLTLKTYVPPSWKGVRAKQGDKTLTATLRSDQSGPYVLYQAIPNGENIVIMGN